MVFVNPAAAAMSTGQFYNKEGADYYLSKAKLESDYSDVRFERELAVFRQFVPRGSVLDVGCGSGAFLFQLKKRWPGDYITAGTDVSGAPLDYAESQGVPVIRGDFLKHDFGEERFDAITFWAVIEHLSDPKAFLEKANSIISDGGLCFVLVPNLRSLAVRLLGVRYRYVYPQHLNYFSAASLRKLVEPYFKLNELRTMHFNPIVIWQDFRAGGRDVSNAERGELLKRTTAYKQSAALKPVKLLYRATEKMLGALKLADNLVAVLRKR
jgi:2-polyprenyl-3-methyl-5-hydroxy-6-metoxy-1,4-benzoquinol methylase